MTNQNFCMVAGTKQYQMGIPVRVWKFTMRNHLYPSGLYQLTRSVRSKTNNQLSHAAVRTESSISQMTPFGYLYMVSHVLLTLNCHASSLSKQDTSQQARNTEVAYTKWNINALKHRTLKGKNALNMPHISTQMLHAIKLSQRLIQNNLTKHLHMKT